MINVSVVSCVKIFELSQCKLKFMILSTEFNEETFPYHLFQVCQIFLLSCSSLTSYVVTFLIRKPICSPIVIIKPNLVRF